jgi:hypothetical protein
MTWTTSSNALSPDGTFAWRSLPHHCTAEAISNHPTLPIGETIRQHCNGNWTPVPLSPNRAPGFFIDLNEDLSSKKQKPRDTLRGFDKDRWG